MTLQMLRIIWSGVINIKSDGEIGREIKNNLENEKNEGK